MLEEEGSFFMYILKFLSAMEIREEAVYRTSREREREREREKGR